VPENGFTYGPSNGGTLVGSGTLTGGLSLTTKGYNFGTVAIGTTSGTYGTVLSNSTSSAATLTLGSVSAPFTSTTNCGATLAAGASCNLDFTFTPISTAAQSQSFAIAASVGGAPVTITTNGAATSAIVLTGTGGNGPFAAYPASSTFSYYDFTSSSPLTDQSGNGRTMLACSTSNNCGTNGAPTLLPGIGYNFTTLNEATNQGLMFAQQTFHTVFIAATTGCYGPGCTTKTTGINGSPIATNSGGCIVCSTSTSDGVLIHAYRGAPNYSGPITNNLSAWSASVIPTTGTPSYVSGIFGGYHVFTFVCPTTGSYVEYVDGVQVGYTQQGTCPDPSTVQQYAMGIGHGDQSAFGLGNFVAHMVGWDTSTTVPSASTIAATASGITQYLNQKGAIPVAPLAPNTTSQPTEIIIGSSIEAGKLSGTYPYGPPYQNTYIPYAFANWGLGSESAGDYCNIPDRGLPSANASLGRMNVLIAGAPTNDMALYGASPTTANQNQADCVALANLIGATPIAIDNLPRSVGGSTNSSAANTLLYANYQADGFAKVVAIGSTSGMGNSTAYQGGCFNADGVHPSPIGTTACDCTPANTATSGYACLAQAKATVENYIFSPYTSSNPHAVTGSYTMITGTAASGTPFDVNISETCAANTNCVITLMPPDYMIDSPVTIQLTNQPGTVTVQAPAGYTLNGMTTPQQITATTSFTQQLVGGTTAGSNWVTQ
jgi:hypothetical protein